MEFLGLPEYKPVSVPLRATVIPLGRILLSGSSDLPGSSKERAVPPPLFGLAPRGVYPAGPITRPAVRSYRTFSPLPRFRGGIFSVALSVSRMGPRPLAGTPPCGDRTFLSRFRERLPVRQPMEPLSHFQRHICTGKHPIPGSNPKKLLQITAKSGVS